MIEAEVSIDSDEDASVITSEDEFSVDDDDIKQQYASNVAEKEEKRSPQEKA